MEQKSEEKAITIIIPSGLEQPDQPTETALWTHDRLQVTAGICKVITVVIINWQTVLCPRFPVWIIYNEPFL